MKPLFTNTGRQSLTETLPDWCGPLARCLSGGPQPKVNRTWLPPKQLVIMINFQLKLTFYF